MNKITLIIILATLGLVLSADIYLKKHSKKKITCAFNDNCAAVLTSKYGKTMGVGNEVFGIAYYSFILVSMALKLNIPILEISFLTVLASIYLLFIQVFILKKYCLICISTAIINLVIFALIFIN